MERRSALVIVAALVAGPVAATADPVVVYLEDAGHFWVGLGVVGVGAPDDGDPVPPAGIGAVNLERYDVWIEQCRRSLSFSLLYEPEALGVGEGAPSAELGYTFRVEIANETLAYGEGADVQSPGHGYPLGVPPGAGWYTVDLFLIVGAHVNWEFTLRGLDVMNFPPFLEEPACP